MRPLMLSRLPHTLLPLLFAACGRVSTDDIDECDVTREPLAEDTSVSTVGFAASDVLAWAETEHSLTGAWSTPPTGMQWSAVAGEVQVDVALSRGAGKAAELTSCGGSKSVGIPVKVEVRTADGELRESLDAELVAMTKDTARLRVETKFDQLRGTLEVSSAAKNDELVQPYLDARMAPCGWSGVFSAIHQRRTSDALSDLPMPPMLEFTAPDGCSVPSE